MSELYWARLHFVARRAEYFRWLRFFGWIQVQLLVRAVVLLVAPLQQTESLVLALVVPVVAMRVLESFDLAVMVGQP